MIPSPGWGECRRQPVAMSLAQFLALSLSPTLSLKKQWKKCCPAQGASIAPFLSWVGPGPCSWSSLMEAAKLLTSQTYRTTERQSPLKSAATAPILYDRYGNGCPEGKASWPRVYSLRARTSGWVPSPPHPLASKMLAASILLLLGRLKLPQCSCREPSAFCRCPLLPGVGDAARGPGLCAKALLQLWLDRADKATLRPTGAPRDRT